jgi:hypothetical protein
MNLVNKMGKGAAMEKRKILTSHGALAALASKRIIVGRFMTLADAVRDHEGRTAALPLGRRPHDEALYDRLHKVDAERTS